MRLPFLSAGAAKGVVTALAEMFAAQTGVEAAGAFGAVGAMKEMLAAGEPCDVIILTAPMVEALESAGEVAPGTSAPLGRVRTGLAVRAGDPLPLIGDAAALSLALRDATAIYLPDPQRATAGVHFIDVLERLGIRAAVESRLRAFPNGATAMHELAGTTDAGCIGCTQVSEILYTPGVTLVGALPHGFELSTVYSVAVCTRARHPELAGQFAALIAGADSLALRLRGGFDA